jgi:hypothetical protein
MENGERQEERKGAKKKGKEGEVTKQPSSTAEIR